MRHPYNKDEKTVIEAIERIVKDTRNEIAYDVACRIYDTLSLYIKSEYEKGYYDGYADSEKEG